MRKERDMEKMEALYEKVASDSYLQSKFNEIMTAAEKDGAESTEVKLIAFASEAGFDVKLEEMQAFFKNMESKTGELTDTELDMVAGGKSGDSILSSVLSFGVSCAIASAIYASHKTSCNDYFKD